MDYRDVTVEIKRNQEDTSKEILLTFTLQNADKLNEINLTSDSSEDLENFFSNIFDYMISNNCLLKFLDIKGENNDLYEDVSKDLITHLNSEIETSKNQIEEIINMKN